MPFALNGATRAAGLPPLGLDVRSHTIAAVSLRELCYVIGSRRAVYGQATLTAPLSQRRHIDENTLNFVTA